MLGASQFFALVVSVKLLALPPFIKKTILQTERPTTQRWKSEMAECSSKRLAEGIHIHIHIHISIKTTKPLHIFLDGLGSHSVSRIAS